MSDNPAMTAAQFTKATADVAEAHFAATAPKLNIHDAIVACMEKVRSVAKSDRHSSPQANFNFRGIDAVVNALGPVMREFGVVPTPKVLKVGYRDVKTSTGKDTREVTVLVRYRFTGPDGSHLDAVVPGESMDSGDKGSAKAMSVAFRIAMLQVFAIPTTEADPDHDAYERGEAVRAQEAQTAPAAQEETPAQKRNRYARGVVQVGAKLGLELPALEALFAKNATVPLKEAPTEELQAFGKHLEAELAKAEEAAALARAADKVHTAFPEPRTRSWPANTPRP